MVPVADDVQFNLRIPITLKDKVKNAAKESGRSINAEAQHRLEQSFISNNNLKELIRDMPLQDFVELVFEKTNSGALSLTIEEIKRGKEAP